jgi:hypothetical protein
MCQSFSEGLSQSYGIPAAAWWTWDEPYKISYGEYVRNQAEKDTGKTLPCKPMIGKTLPCKLMIGKASVIRTNSRECGPHATASWLAAVSI